MLRMPTFACLLLLSTFPPGICVAKQLQLDVGLAYPTMFIEDAPVGTNHLRIALTGFEIPEAEQRDPVNVAIVIDKSGSMQGEKIAQARKAALQAVDRLGKDDIVSIIVYDTSVSVLVPATKASDRESIQQKIQQISAGGNTALHAGVLKGAEELRKFLDRKRVNRVILLSDGLANVGPSTPGELEELGASLLEEGISVSTMGLGLGYNEELMSRLALASSGNHVFIEDADSLVAVFQREFDDVLSVVAQNIRIQVELSDGVRPVKLLNYPAVISGQKVEIELGQLYSQQQRYFVLELEIPFGKANSVRPVARVSTEYLNMLTDTTDKLTSSVEVRFSDDKEIAEQQIDKTVLSACVVQIANERNRQATLLRDEGKVEEARQLLTANAAYLNKYYAQLGLEELKVRSELNLLQSTKLQEREWAANRKQMVESYYSDLSQQRYSGSGQKTPDK